MTGLIAPSASAATTHVVIIKQPTDASVNALITGDPFDPAAAGPNGFVQVKVTQDALGGPVNVPGAPVTFTLAVGSGLATTGSFHVETRYTNGAGIATFGPEAESSNPLSIGEANEPFSTDYRLVPSTLVGETTVTGDTSAAFDIWDKGCHGTGCNIDLRGPGLDRYSTTENVGLGGSVVGTGAITINCPGQTLIFSSSVFVNVTSGSGAVLLESHITRAEMKAASNNGQAHVDWCVGLKTAGPWNFPRRDTNNDGSVGAGDLYVGFAPKCPKRDAALFAPCILSQTSDGLGGNITRGYLPGGDPPRRT
jgi:hypothetical protein